MCQQQPDPNKVRRTRFVIVRNTAAQLRETVLADAKRYFEGYFVHKVSTQTLYFDFNLGDGTSVSSEWLLIPLERPEDQRKLLSLNITAAFIEECREVPYDIVAAVMGRIGRFPSVAIVKPTWQALIMVSNPWSVSSEYHENLYINPPEGWELFIQPGGMDPDAENIQYLPEGYYERLLHGQSDEWVRVHVHGRFGEDQFGQAVYKAVFRPEDHLVDSLTHNAMLPIIVGIDFGRTPSAVVTQEDMRGRLLFLEEITSEDMGLNAFIHELLIPRLMEKYASSRVFVVGDPAGAAKSQLSEETAFTVLRKAGLEAVPAPTNDPKRRIEAVERRLLSRVNQGADCFISREGCPRLVTGFYRGYRYKKQRTGELTPLPEKNEFSHVHDAAQYAALGHQSGYVGKRVMRQERKRVPRQGPVFDRRAWT